MEFNYTIVVAAIVGICAIIGIYYCWVRKMNRQGDTSATSGPGFRS